jgi:hypothetical protein
VRVPDAPFVRAVARQHRSALALTSANVSGGLSSVAVDEFQARQGAGSCGLGVGLAHLAWPCPLQPLVPLAIARLEQTSALHFCFPGLRVIVVSP